MQAVKPLLKVLYFRKHYKVVIRIARHKFIGKFFYNILAKNLKEGIASTKAVLFVVVLKVANVHKDKAPVFKNHFAFLKEFHGVILKFVKVWKARKFILGRFFAHIF